MNPAKAARKLEPDSIDDAIRQMAPTNDFEPVTPSNSKSISRNARALWVGTGGDVVALNAAGQAVTFKNVPDGSILPIATKRVNSTGTTATDIVAL